MVWAIAITCIVLGAAGRFWVGQRSFHRRNMAGVEEFSSYASMVGNRFLEKVVQLASSAMLLVGVLALLGLWMSSGHEAPKKTAEAHPTTSSAPAKPASKR